MDQTFMSNTVNFTLMTDSGWKTFLEHSISVLCVCLSLYVFVLCLRDVRWEHIQICSQRDRESHVQYTHANKPHAACTLRHHKLQSFVIFLFHFRCTRSLSLFELWSAERKHSVFNFFRRFFFCYKILYSILFFVNDAVN